MPKTVIIVVALDDKEIRDALMEKAKIEVKGQIPEGARAMISHADDGDVHDLSALIEFQYSNK